MPLLRHSLLIASVALCSCIHSPVPEPPEFRLTPDALQQKYPAARTTGAVRLFAGEIVTTRDDFGRETHLASGGAMLLKDSNPPIHAKASTILITPDFAEARGTATVKKDDRLYIGKDESTKIIIDGTAIKPEGPHDIRKIAPETVSPENSETEAITATTPPEPAVEPRPAPRPEPPKVKRQPASKPKPKT
ncbi:MAG TPA: hypothetical protein PLB55_18435, partial [Prosthecobacter sp.]|nr:hypothetical protein [Prosthecobacter sp.]